MKHLSLIPSISIFAALFMIMTTAVATPSSLDVVDNYQVTYIPSAPSCRLANCKDAYTYTILAEDYMAQVNLISTIGKEDPDIYMKEMCCLDSRMI